MSVVCFDTHFLIWGIKQEAQPSQQSQSQVVAIFFILKMLLFIDLLNITLM